MKNILNLIVIALFFTSCEKVIDIDYKNNQPAIIIEGNITNEAGPYFVKVTKSIGLTVDGDYPTIDDALVTISDDAGSSETLISIGDGTYSTTTLRGAEGRTYILTVEAQGETYTARSTMPQIVPFESIVIDEVKFAGESQYNVIPVYQDPIGKGNNYRFVMTLNGKLINQHLVLNDEVNNGLVNTLKLEIDDSDMDLKPSDLISIEMQCVDKKVSSFYTFLSLIGDSNPGGGTTPNNPPNNISNGALGLFSAHTVETKRVVIP